MKKRVVVTGIGVISPLGNTIEEMWDSLSKGKGGAAKVTSFDTTEFVCKIAANVKNFNAEKYNISKKDERLPDFIKFAVAASVDAVKDSGLDLKNDKIDLDRVGVVIGSGIGGIGVMEEQSHVLKEKGPRKVSPFLVPFMIVDMAAGQVAIHHGVKGPNLCVATACASGAHAIGEAVRIIQHGDADFMIAGGTETGITPLGFAGFCSARALTTRNDDPERASRPFDKDRDGFLMGEGAGIVILETYEHAKARNAHIYAEIAGYGMSGDAYHITSPIPDGSGAVLAMKSAIKDARITHEEIGYINAHGTSTKINDSSETLAIKKVFGDLAYKIPVSSTKSMTGHLLGAAGSLEAIICALTIKHGVIPPTINYETPDPECDLDYVPNVAREKKLSIVMTNSLGFGGHNVSLILKKV